MLVFPLLNAVPPPPKWRFKPNVSFSASKALSQQPLRQAPTMSGASGVPDNKARPPGVPPLTTGRGGGLATAILLVSRRAENWGSRGSEGTHRRGLEAEGGREAPMRGKRKKSVSVLQQRLRAGLCRWRLFPFIRGETGSRSALTSPPSHAHVPQHVYTSGSRRGL